MGKHNKPEPEEDNTPELVRRRANRKSVIRSGRTIGEAREQLETKNERNAARKKDKKKKSLRILFTIFGFIVIAVAIFCIVSNLVRNRDNLLPSEDTVENLTPTVKIIDEDATGTSKITSRMNTYIAEAESDFRSFHFTPTKAVVPSGSIRVIHFYLEGYNGYIKMTIDRNAAESVEDAERLIRYLKEQGINDFEYLDVRIPNKAYWK
ncbi:hypothetical protein IKF92_00420 [Candidatus Saccharibacteria bacterium]|nr:hypothetical protein [Candidatus Saccharibacteria bacterium]